MQRLRAAALGLTVTAALIGVTACGGQSGASHPARTVTKTPDPVTVTATVPSLPTQSLSTASASQVLYLSDLDPLTSTRGVDTSTVEINGQAFARSVTLAVNAAGPVASAEYNLGRHWDTFSATVGLGDESPTGGLLTFEASVDGRQEYSQTIPLGKTQRIGLGVNGALRLKLTVTYSGQDAANSFYGCWGNAHLQAPPK